MNTYFTKINDAICGNCGNYPVNGKDVENCSVTETLVSRYRPVSDCIKWYPPANDGELGADHLKTKEDFTMLQNIDITKICSHPDNPRKDLGDLTELAESIKARGIMQNLTVVPWFTKITGSITYNDNQDKDPLYTVVIGHRRLAAAKLAGLTEVPCIISDMDYKDQIGTMLLENIQRNDLTVYEQAQGFQMMLDLGETISGISGQTGFSETTIRRRVKLNELDQKKFQESIARGGTLMDYAELEKIHDVKLKNKVLEFIGTRDFDWKLRGAIEDQEKPVRKAALIKELDTFAKKIKKTGDVKGSLSYEKNFSGHKMDGWKKPKDAGTAEYFYIVDDYGTALYRRSEKEKETKKTTAAEKEFRKSESQLKDLSKRAYESRYEFVKGFTAGKKHVREINDFVMRRLLKYGSPDIDNLLKMFGIEKPDEKENDWSKMQDLKRNLILKKFDESPEYAMLVAAYCGFGDSGSNDYYSAHSWENKIIHEKNETLDQIYDTLFSLGYEMSEEERQLQDGSHELFTVGKKEARHDAK